MERWVVAAALERTAVASDKCHSLRGDLRALLAHYDDMIVVDESTQVMLDDLIKVSRWLRECRIELQRKLEIYVPDD